MYCLRFVTLGNCLFLLVSEPREGILLLTKSKDNSSTVKRNHYIQTTFLCEFLSLDKNSIQWDVSTYGCSMAV